MRRIGKNRRGNILFCNYKRNFSLRVSIKKFAFTGFIIAIGYTGIWLIVKENIRAGFCKPQLDAILMPQLTPWQSVGGCGASGSGGGATGIKWIGEGVSGGLINVEVLPRYNFGQNFSFLSIPPRVSFKPTWNMEVGITMPFSSKIAEVQYRSNQPANTIITGGFGDLSLDFSRIFGSEGQFDLNFSLSFPTGQFDIKRSAEQYFVPINLQMGSGVYIAALRFMYTRDIEDGLLLWDGTVTFPFNMRPFTAENKYLDEYFSAYKNEKSNERFYYRFKPYGESDIGDYVPPNVSASFTWAYRGVKEYVHSFGVTFSVPIGVAWIHSEKSGEYNPKPDPDHKAWQALLTYGLEFSREKFPVFIGIGLPINDRKPSAGEIAIDEYDPDPMKKWNAPDWNDFMKQWILAVGIKAAMF